MKSKKITLASLSALGVLVMLVCFAGDDSRPVARAATAKTVVLYYGDSLARESQTYFQQALSPYKNVQVVYAAFPGTAPCDWYARMGQNNKKYPGALVVGSFYGNLLTQCVIKAQKGGWQKTYLNQLTGAMQKMSSAERVWLALPPIAPATGSKRQIENWQNLQTLSKQFPVLQPFDAGAAVEASDGSFALGLPCLPGEPCTNKPYPGQNQVRSFDLLHFCPGVHSNYYLRCSVYDSGAWRYGNALAKPVIDYLSSRQ